MTSIDYATAPAKSDLTDTVSRIATGLGADPAAALECIDGIRKLKYLPPLPPELSTELLVWEERLDKPFRVEQWDASSVAGRYCILRREEGFEWILENVTMSNATASLETGMAAVRLDLEARITAMVRSMPNKLSWQDFDRDSRVTSRTVAYRVAQIDIGEWMITLHDREPTSEMFATREAAKEYVHAHWMREHLTLFALPDSQHPEAHDG